MKKFTEAKNLFESLEADAEKFYSKSNSAAGTRVRQAMQELKKLAPVDRNLMDCVGHQTSLTFDASNER
jgi:hypothetical protein